MNMSSMVRSLVLAGGLGLSSSVFAQVQPPVVTLGPLEAVPTLGTGLLLALAGLLALVGVRLLGTRGMHGGVQQLLVGGAFVALAAGAVLSVDGARAVNGGGSPEVVVVGDEKGGQYVLPVLFDGGLNTWQVLNDTNQTLQIKAIDTGYCEDPMQVATGPGIALPQNAVEDGECSVGRALDAGAYCTLELVCLNFAQPG